MKCDVCRKLPAVIFVQQVSRGSSIELHLCESCARERGYSTTENRIDVSLGGLFSGILDTPLEESAITQACPQCGLTFPEIKKHRRTGCAHCYQYFRAEIVSLMRRDGLEISYRGSLPSTKGSFKATGIDPDKLRRELQSALDQEDYEMAAYYRDRLRALGGSK
jgi:protein arginine kinase activator